MVARLACVCLAATSLLVAECSQLTAHAKPPDLPIDIKVTCASQGEETTADNPLPDTAARNAAPEIEVLQVMPTETIEVVPQTEYTCPFLQQKAQQAQQAQVAPVPLGASVLEN